MKILLLFIALVCAAIAADRKSAPLPLTVIDVWPESHLEARRLVVAAVLKENLEPREYFAEVQARDAGKILDFVLWHESALKNLEKPDARGDPTGKCRTVIYDSVAKKVIGIYRWQ